MPEAVVGLEERVRPPGQDDARPGHPVRLLAVDQVTDDVEGVERVGAFHPADPGVGKPVEEGVQRTRRPREDLSGEFEIEVHGAVFTAGGKSLRNTPGEAAR